MVGFLLVIAPGLLWEILRERERPALPGSTFREVSRVALVSLLCTGAALTALAAVRAIAPNWMPDPGAWARHDNYLDDHYRLVGRALIIELALACTLAWLPHRFPAVFASLAQVLLPRSVKLTSDPVLWGVFGVHGELRPGSAKLAVVVRLHDGTRYGAEFGAVDLGSDRDSTYLALQGRVDRRLPNAGAATPLDLPSGRLVLSMADVRDVWVFDASAEESVPVG